jgi:hypothetical protein
MKNESLLFFKTPESFFKFLNSLDIYNDWKITKGTMNSRGESIRNKGYTKFLRERFNNKKMFRRSVSISEIVSWLDSFVIMRRFFKKLYSSITVEEFNNIELYCEYMIKMSKKMRIDFILKYKNTILLIEFRMVNDFTKIKSTWNKKKVELLVYKELLENYIPTETRILTFAFISLFEYDGRNIEDIQLNYNNNQVDFLAEYFTEFVVKKYKGNEK